MIRYFVRYYAGNQVVGIIYDDTRSQVRIGGPMKFRILMCEIINSYFKKPLPRAVSDGSGKIRMVIREVSIQRFIEVKKQMKEDSFSFQETKSLGRLQR